MGGRKGVIDVHIGKGGQLARELRVVLRLIRIEPEVLKEKDFAGFKVSGRPEHLAAENVIGWFQGRMEFGPRALGGRSIIGDPRSATMQSVMNRTSTLRSRLRRLDMGARLIEGTTCPLGRPRWLMMITLPPLSRTWFIVGSVALIRVSSVI